MFPAPSDFRDPNYKKANIPVFLLRSLFKTLDELGVLSPRLTIGLGFSIEDLDDPACRISFRQGRETIRRALKLTKGQALGLETGRRETLNSVGLVGYAMSTCQTLGEAFALGVELQRETGAMLDFYPTIENGMVRISAMNRYLDPEIHAFLFEEAFAYILQSGRELLGQSFSPLRVDLPYPAPAYAEAYADVFGCEIRFDQTAGHFCYDAAWHDAKLPSADVLTHRQVVNFLRQGRGQGADNEEIIRNVERQIYQNLDRQISINEVAKQLFMSERTLRRRLSDCGVSFSAMVDRLRNEKAQELLVNPRISIEQIAYAVGFSGPQNFHHAFRRWTGKTPGKLRREVLAAWQTRA